MRLFNNLRRASQGQMIKAGILALLGGLAMLIIYGNQYLEERQTLSWPSVNGTITEAESYHRQRPNRHGSTAVSGVNVSYSYTVDGHPYTGTNYRLWSNELKRNEADQVAAAMPPGSTKEVFYNPQYPSISCLVTGYSDIPWAVFGVGAGFALMGTLALASTLKRR